MMKVTYLVTLGAAVVAASEKRQLHTVPNRGPSSSTTTTTSLSTSTSTSTTTTTTATSTTPPPTSTFATQTGPARWELTTVFTQPTECVIGITQYAGDWSTLGYWQNIPYPAPGITLTSCYPPALLPSVTAESELPPYNQLVCPYQWESFDYNSTYRICCPKNFGFYLPEYGGDRPGENAWCTSWARPGTHAALTRYFTNGASTLIDTTLGSSEKWLVQATAFDGNIATNVATSTSSSSSTTPTSTSSSTSTTSATPTSTTTSSTSSTSTATTTTTSPPPVTTTTTTTPSWTGPTAVNALPSCGQTCIGNMLAKHQELGCGDQDIACLCRAPNFNYGVRDCANAACPDAGQASTVIAFETSYWCPQAMATGTHSPTQAPTPTAISDLPACGQTCMNNMIGQSSQLGCPNGDPYCLCGKADFGYGIRDCANGACGAVVASTVIAYESMYCSSASATPTPTAFHLTTEYHNDCTGSSHNDNTIMMYQDGACINTDCQVASLNISPEGNCPDGQVQISYWEKPNCQGKWFGYGYSKRGTCRSLWSDGWKFQSLHLRCAKQQDDCVSKGTCTADPEPSNNLC